MGYRAAVEDTVVITAMIGPGPNASHGRFHFEPDQSWQLDAIAEHYEASARRETYLGDWHSHPNATSGEVSAVDRRVLKAIITAPEARCREPLMALFYGDPSRWRVDIWRARLGRRALCGMFVLMDEATLKQHERRKPPSI
jgi:integrative and conjugative element protein (TIGR02256 family)